ncbi:MAG: hypothetical protein KatS3mg099_374 [Candidatus Parcubacteria bacterium]|nr:MAG: hypothetical protein KatS3mg099_374 [Candidatus Parcubacteria bacterium]
MTRACQGSEEVWRAPKNRTPREGRSARAAALSALSVAAAGGLLWAATVFSGVTYRAAPSSAPQTPVATTAAPNTQGGNG